MRDAGLGDAFGNGVARTKKKRRKFKWLFRRSRWRRCEYLTAGTATRTGTFQYPLYEGGWVDREVIQENATVSINGAIGLIVFRELFQGA